MTPLIPRPFQVKSADITVAARNQLIRHQCGLGKTLIALEVIRRTARGPVLIVCNKNARRQWVDEILRQKEGGLPVKYLDVAGDGGRFDWEALKPWVSPRRPGVYLIIHWEGVRRNYKALQKAYWDVVVADEAHKIRNRTTLTAHALKSLHAGRRLALTATPDEKSVADMWSILHWLQVPKLPGYWTWFDKYVDYDIIYPTGGKAVKGNKRDPVLLAELQKFLDPWVHGWSKAQVAPDLPPLQISYIPVDLSPDHRKLYEQLLKGELTLPERDEPVFLPNHLAKLTRALQLIVAPALLGFACPSAKLEWLDDYLTDNPSECIVIGTRYRFVAQHIAKKYQAPLVVGGAGPDAARPFLDGSSRLLVGTIAAMKESLNLQRASTMILLDREWSATTMNQIQDRIHRMNITEPKHLICLQAPKTYDLLVDKAYREKWDDQRILFELTHNKEAYV